MMNTGIPKMAMMLIMATRMPPPTAFPKLLNGKSSSSETMEILAFPCGPRGVLALLVLTWVVSASSSSMPTTVTAVLPAFVFASLSLVTVTFTFPVESLITVVCFWAFAREKWSSGPVKQLQFVSYDYFFICFFVC